MKSILINREYLDNAKVDFEEFKYDYGYGAEADIYDQGTLVFIDKKDNLLEDTDLIKQEIIKKYNFKEIKN